ncbi:hypothetical protein F53441_4725 [Fusarium austroafricanum]|uniref:Uncharacterized protein n=1 Tax=Fusarium austroafricanum TaxID=2364996 RepID=A0A8H4NYI2_9HYPO|nr:hypothetical protein F53441_4725 [Fusarium austroafricanum]
MSGASERLISPASETELEILSPSLSATPVPGPPQSRNKRRGRQSSIVEQVKHAFRDAWNDISSIERLKSLDWAGLGRLLLCITWTSLLVISPILLSTLPLDDDGSPCKQDGKFKFSTEVEENKFGRWAAGGFFDVTLSWGSFNFATAKLIDVAWDLVVGRGFQVIMALIAWQVYVQHLEVSLASRPATYTTIWLLRFQQESSVMATSRLARQFFLRRLPSTTAMIFMILASSFILAFPTFAGSMTGYTPYSEAYLTASDGGLIRFSTIFPIAYIIHDGDRTTKFSKDFAVPWKGDTDLYGLDGRVGDRTPNNLNTTTFRNETIDWPPLNISECKEAVFQVGDEIYNQTQFDKAGVCQPVTGEDLVQRYRWGFSFLQLMIVIFLLQLWTFGLIIMSSSARHALQLNNREPSSRGWKGLLDFAGTVKLQLEDAGIDHHALQDGKLETEIRSVLGGGSISSQPFHNKPLSIWRRLWKRKSRVLVTMFAIALTLINNLYHFADINLLVARVPILVGLCLTVAFSVGNTILQVVGTFIVAAALAVVPFLFYNVLFYDYMLPGACFGITMALFIGSTRGSSLVLFFIPFLFNYLVVLIALFSIHGPSGYYWVE